MGFLEAVGVVALMIVLVSIFPRISFVVVFIMVLINVYNVPLFTEDSDSLSVLVSILMVMGGFGALFLDIATLGFFAAHS